MRINVQCREKICGAVYHSIQRGTGIKVTVFQAEAEPQLEGIYAEPMWGATLDVGFDLLGSSR
jgi:hypothetical protein